MLSPLPPSSPQEVLFSPLKTNIPLTYTKISVINPPPKAPNSTLAEYAMAAKGVATAGAPPQVTGGRAGNGSVAASSSSSAVAPVAPVPTGGVGRKGIAAGGVGIWIVGGVVGAW